MIPWSSVDVVECTCNVSLLIMLWPIYITCEGSQWTNKTHGIVLFCCNHIYPFPHLLLFINNQLISMYMMNCSIISLQELHDVEMIHDIYDSTFTLLILPVDELIEACWKEWLTFWEHYFQCIFLIVFLQNWLLWMFSENPLRCVILALIDVKRFGFR